MEKVRKIMSACRQHYEKIILSAVLLVLAGAVWYAYGASEDEAAKIQKGTKEIKTRRVKGVPQENLSSAAQTLARLEKPEPFVLAPPHNLFNPVEWQSNRVTTVVRRIRAEEEVGPERLELIKTDPLIMSIGFAKPVGQGDAVTSYQIPYTNYTLRPAVVFPVPVFSINTTNPKVPFILREVKGQAGNPDEIVVELRDANATKATITATQPYVHVEAYTADLRYPLEKNAVFTARRVGNVLRFAGKDYKIVEIRENEVVVVSPKNKPTVVRKK